MQETLTLRDMEADEDAVWNFLLFAGYLKPVNLVRRDRREFVQLALVNGEIQLIFEDLFRGWMERGLGGKTDVERLIRALMEGDVETFETLLEKLLVTVMSFQDPAGRAPEKLYHGFIAGILVHLGANYHVRSNRESGLGRADVLVIPRTPGRPGVVFELKSLRTRNRETPEAALKAAAQQLRHRNYAAELQEAHADPIYELAVVFDGKRVWARPVPEILESASASDA